jgi:alpha-tubulin suppressor-like RCC1 family protein
VGHIDPSAPTYHFNTSIPRLLTLLSPHDILDVSFGDDFTLVAATGTIHCLALDEGGEVWGWGHNDYGQLSLSGNTKSVTSPLKIMLAEKITKIQCSGSLSGAISESYSRKVAQICCGAWHVLALTENGIGVQTSGDNSVTEIRKTDLLRN